MWTSTATCPALEDKNLSVLDYYYRLNKDDPNYSNCRATRDRGRNAHTDNRFNLLDKAVMEILKLYLTPEKDLENKKIDFFDDAVLKSNFWPTGARCSPSRTGIPPWR